MATVVPIFTASIRSTGIGSPRRHAQQVADAGDRGVAVLLGILREQLVGDERAVGLARDDVGERAAAVDPELPAGFIATICTVEYWVRLHLSYFGLSASRIPN